MTAPAPGPSPGPGPGPDLGPLLRPRSVAIIGASSNQDAIPGLPQRILAQHGYSGAVYPVNPRHTELAGLPCYPDIGAVPGPVDVAIVVVAAARVAEVTRACGEAGVRFVVIISSGFAEQFDGGPRQRELRAVCDAYPGTRVLGPNAEGLINVPDRVPLGFSPTINYDRGLRRLITGDVAVIAQSGGLGFALFNDGLGRGLGFSHVISTGNEVDLDLADLAWYVLHRPDTRVLLLFMEGLAQAPARLAALGAAARRLGKRIVVAKVGSSPASRRAALAHTAHDPGDDAAYAALLAAHDLPRAADQEELVDLALVLSRTRRPAGPRIGVVTTSGGAGTWLADDLVAAGLEVPLLSEGLRARLRALMPAYGSPANPVDATAQVLGHGGIAPVIRTLAAGGEVDAIVLIATLADPKQLLREHDALAAAAAELPMVVYSYTRPDPRSVELLAGLGLAWFTSGRRAARAMRVLVGG